MDKDLERKLRPDMDPAEVDAIVDRHYRDLEQDEEFVPIDTLSVSETLSFPEEDILTGDRVETPLGYGVLQGHDPPDSYVVRLDCGGKETFTRDMLVNQQNIPHDTAITIYMAGTNLTAQTTGWGEITENAITFNPDSKGEPLMSKFYETQRDLAAAFASNKTTAEYLEALEAIAKAAYELWMVIPHASSSRVAERASVLYDALEVVNFMEEENQ